MKRTFAFRLGKHLRQRGLLGTAQKGFSYIRKYFRLHTLEAEDREFDRQYGIDSACKVPLDEFKTLTSAEHSYSYWPTPPRAIELLLGNLQVPWHDFTFLDFGSGMGRAVLMASDFPFKKIIGVEFSPDLHRIAQQNLLNYKNPRQKCHNIELVCRDVLDFPLPAENTLLYLFNPFKKPIMERVLKKLRLSLEDHPREVLVAHYYAEYDLVDLATFLEKVCGGEDKYGAWTARFAIYQSRVTKKAKERPRELRVGLGGV